MMRPTHTTFPARSYPLDWRSLLRLVVAGVIIAFHFVNLLVTGPRRPVQEMYSRYLLLVNMLGFFITWFDKQIAISGGGKSQRARPRFASLAYLFQRIPETALHFLVFLGGWPGCSMAQVLSRHKIRKASFQVVMAACSIAHHQILYFVFTPALCGVLEELGDARGTCVLAKAWYLMVQVLGYYLWTELAIASFGWLFSVPEVKFGARKEGFRRD